MYCYFNDTDTSCGNYKSSECRLPFLDVHHSSIWECQLYSIRGVDNNDTRSNDTRSIGSTSLASLKEFNKIFSDFQKAGH